MYKMLFLPPITCFLKGLSRLQKQSVLREHIKQERASLTCHIIVFTEVLILKVGCKPLQENPSLCTETLENQRQEKEREIISLIKAGQTHI